MQGRIIVVKKRPKLEVWADTPDESDLGGYCHICKKRIYNTLELVRHFVREHKGGM